MLYGYSSSQSSDDSVVEEEGTCRKHRSAKASFSVEDRYCSFFYKQYLSPTVFANGIEHDDSRLGVNFRRRFRVPFPVFSEIFTDIEKVMGKKTAFDRSGAERIKVDLLVLGSLRVVGSGCTFDAIEELTNVAQETHCCFFHEQFCRWGERVSPVHIKMPNCPVTARHVLGLYKRRGFPGYVGSVDCVHVVWDKCPA